MIRHVKSVTGKNHGGPGGVSTAAPDEALVPDNPAGLQVRALGRTSGSDLVNMALVDHRRPDADIPGRRTRMPDAMGRGDIARAAGANGRGDVARTAFRQINQSVAEAGRAVSAG